MPVFKLRHLRSSGFYTTAARESKPRVGMRWLRYCEQKLRGGHEEILAAAPGRATEISGYGNATTTLCVNVHWSILTRTTFGFFTPDRKTLTRYVPSLSWKVSLEPPNSWWNSIDGHGAVPAIVCKAACFMILNVWKSPFGCSGPNAYCNNIRLTVDTGTPP